MGAARCRIPKLDSATQAADETFDIAQFQLLFCWLE